MPDGGMFRPLGILTNLNPPSTCTLVASTHQDSQISVDGSHGACDCAVSSGVTAASAIRGALKGVSF